MICFEQRPEFVEFANRLMGQKFAPDRVTTISQLDAAGRPVGVVLFSDFNECNGQISVASTTPRFLSRSLLRTVFGYVFGQCNLRRVTCFVATDNGRSLSLARRLGFVPEGILARWFGEKDGIVLRMLPEECRWLGGNEHGQRFGLGQPATNA